MNHDWHFTPTDPIKKRQVPTVTRLINSVVKALIHLGGVGTNRELFSKVVELENIPKEIAEIYHIAGPKTLLEYRLAWARTRLKEQGIIESVEKGKWRLTSGSKQP